jgi:Asp-tRNA(Asn)/Glu-tRNA(Gln) amidotransferase A subunit family amidase
MKYEGMTCSSGSPAFANLVAGDDSFVAEQLRKAGAVCIGTTNTPPMMASGMHRGLYGRAESPYNLDYLTAAFSSGSSNGSATSTAASFAAFGLGSETVSSGRSPASNNALIAYTGSRDVISPRGVWPLYPTCDVLVPHTRTVKDMLNVLDCLAVKDHRDHENFWSQQKYVTIEEVKRPESFLELLSNAENALKGKRLAAPKMFIGGNDPKAKPTFVSEEVIALWKSARKTLESSAQQSSKQTSHSYQTTKTTPRQATQTTS